MHIINIVLMLYLENVILLEDTVMKPVLIADEYINSLSQVSFPPEISNKQSKINYLVHLGLERLGFIQGQCEARKGQNSGQNDSKAVPYEKSA